MSQKKIVVIGGGSGSAMVLTGLKQYDVALTAVVNMADDGGSSGRLRQELGILPPGDIRQCLLALADNTVLRDLFSYRFDQGSLAGHSVGNLMLAAAESSCDNYLQAMQLLGDLLRIKGSVLPVTTEQVTICMDDGSQILKSEFAIGHAVFATQRPRLWLEPAVALHSAARDAITAADMVVIAPGNLYGSLAPALLVPGMTDALKQSSAAKVYVSNLTTKPGQTDGFSVHDYADEVARFLDGITLDYLVVNDPNAMPAALLHAISRTETIVPITAKHAVPYQVIQTDIVSDVLPEYDPNDHIAHVRSVVCHDSTKVGRALMELP